MTDTVDTPAGEAFSKEYVADLQAKIASQSEETAKLRAFKSTHDAKQRDIIAKLQPDIKSFVNDLVAANPDHAAEMKGIQDWSEGCHESSSLETAMPLARIISCASSQYKRTREEASVASERAGSLGATMKELEEIKSDRDSKMLRISELEKLCSDRQDSMEQLQEALAKAGVIKDKFDFSKLSSREVNATDAEVPKASEATIEKTTSLASRVVEDELMSFVTGLASTGGSHRINQSTTAHAHVGQTAGSVESEIAAAVRGY